MEIALHRAALPGVHEHRRGARGAYDENSERDRKFGSLTTAGPFPVKEEKGSHVWFFPRPQDLQGSTLRPSLTPTAAPNRGQSSLPRPLRYAVGNTLPASKDQKAKGWLCAEAFERYLGGDETVEINGGEALDDCEIFDAEHSVGIGIDPETGTTGSGDVSGKIYSAHYLRLRDAWRLGVLAKAEDMAGGVMENAGLCLDRFGMPYIPGNGVKGCARRMAIQELLEARAKASDDELAKLLADIALVFGWGEEDWTSGSIKQGRIKSDFV